MSGNTGYSLEAILEMMRAFGERNNRVSEIKWAITHATKEPLT